MEARNVSRVILSIFTTNNSYPIAFVLINPFKTPALPVQLTAQHVSKRSAVPTPLNDRNSTHKSSIFSTKPRYTNTRSKEATSATRPLLSSEKPCNSIPDTTGKESDSLSDVFNGGTNKPSGIDYSEYKGRGRYAQTAQK
jgi:hypothetical protein